MEAILFRADQMSLDRKGLEKFLGSKSRGSEVLSCKRRLVLAANQEVA